MEINHRTNRPDLWNSLSVHRQDFCLYDLGHEGHTIPISRFSYSDAWHQARHIFLIDKEAQPQMLETLQNDTRAQVWDSLVMPEELRWHSYFWWWDSTVQLAMSKDLISKLYDPRLNSPDFLFDCVMGIGRRHRWCLYENIMSMNDLKKITFMNFLGAGDTYVSATGESWDYPDSNGVHGSRVHIEDRVTLPLACALPTEIYRKSWFSLVTESREDHTRYFSEKTAKPLLGKRLFILFAAPGMLRDIRILGFETFGSVIDESYDDIEDDHVRWETALAQAQQLARQDPKQVYQKILPVLEHNQRLMLSTSWLAKMMDSMKKILITS